MIARTNITAPAQSPGLFLLLLLAMVPREELYGRL